MKTIIVPIDFSTNSDKACKYAISLARDVNAKIILMHAFESTVLYSKMPLLTVQMDYSYLFNNALHKLKTFYKRISPLAGKIEIELNIQVGLPSARIIELALEKKADLIIMGTTGKGFVDRIMIGSNTSRIIGNAPCMVLVIPPKAIYKGLKKIVYATDMSKDNLKHAQKILTIGKKFNSELVFLNIDENNQDANNNDLKKFKAKIKNVIHYSKMSGFIANDTDVTRGIDYFLKYFKADCLAIYTHHQNIFSRLFNKSITKSLSVHANIPMLVIHESDFEEFKSTQMKNNNLLTILN